MRTIIVTVGTSLLTNRDGQVGQVSRPWQEWRFDQDLPSADTAPAYLASADERQISAETNTLQALPLQENDALFWLHSSTPEGEWCAKVLAEHYESAGHRCTLLKVEGLAYQEASFTARGLKSLLEHTFNIIREAGAQNTVLCATGGFKAEIAFANMVGMLTQVPVYYIHERFRELVELPRVPISWDASIVEQHLDFFEWIDAEPRSSTEAESWLMASPQLRSLTSGSLDGYTYLSPVGDLLYGAYKIQDAAKPQALWPPSSDLQPSEKIKLQMTTPHHRPKGWEKFVQRIAEVPCVGIIHYDSSGAGSVKQSGIYDRNPETGELGIGMKGDTAVLPLLVETTARGTAQLNLVEEYLQRRIRNW